MNLTGKEFVFTSAFDFIIADNYIIHFIMIHVLGHQMLIRLAELQSVAENMAVENYYHDYLTQRDNEFSCR